MSNYYFHQNVMQSLSKDVFVWTQLSRPWQLFSFLLSSYRCQGGPRLINEADGYRDNSVQHLHLHSTPPHFSAPVPRRSNSHFNLCAKHSSSVVTSTTSDQKQASSSPTNKQTTTGRTKCHQRSTSLSNQSFPLLTSLQSPRQHHHSQQQQQQHQSMTTSTTHHPHCDLQQQQPQNGAPNQKGFLPLPPQQIPRDGSCQTFLSPLAEDSASSACYSPSEDGGSGGFFLHSYPHHFYPHYHSGPDSYDPPPPPELINFLPASAGGNHQCCKCVHCGFTFQPPPAPPGGGRRDQRDPRPDFIPLIVHAEEANLTPPRPGDCICSRSVILNDYDDDTDDDKDTRVWKKMKWSESAEISILFWYKKCARSNKTNGLILHEPN